MMTGVRLVRLAAAALVTLAIALGPTVLDACLIRCHADPDASAAIAPACHHHTAQRESSAMDGVAAPLPAVDGVTPCSHDHESLVADTSAERRTAVPSHLTSLPVARSVPLSSGAATIARRSTWTAPSAAPIGAHRLPLRI
jgi:hypothetical protein